MRAAAALVLALLALAAPALGQPAPRVGVRVGTHPDLGRIVFDWPSRVGYGLQEEAGRIVIRFAAPAVIDLAAARRPPRNVLSVEPEGEAVAIRIAPGVQPRHFRLGNRIVVDVRDPAAAGPSGAASGSRRDGEPAARAGSPRGAASPPASAVTPAPDGPRQAPPQPADAPARAAPRNGAGPPPPPAAAAEAVGEPRAAPAAAAPAVPDGAAAVPAPGQTAIRLLRGAPAIAIDAGADAGLAVFRRGAWVHVVLDRAMAPDLSALAGHAIFGGIEARQAGEGTVLRLPAPSPLRLSVRREADAWILEATRAAAPTDAPTLRAATETGPPARLVLEGGEPGGTVTMADSATGETLLVGTLRRPGPGVLVPRRLPEFELLPTMQGAAILARSDRLVLRRTTGERFALEAAAGGSLGLGPPSGQEPPAAALAMSRLLDLPSGPVPALLERLRNVLTAVNAAPPLGRGAVRRDAAETLLALGMPQEAQAMAAIAFREDPQSREDGRLLLAHGVAALLSGRPAEAQGIDDARLPPRDEVALWRALLAIARGEAAAAALAASAPVVLLYPEALRARTMPAVAEALAQRGEAAAAAALLAQVADGPGLDLARAMVAEAQERPGDALAGYEALAAGRDRRQRAMARRRLAELGLAAGRIDQAAAAEMLEQSLYAWRGGAEEVALRRRIASLRLEAGQGQQALALVEETVRLFPDQAGSLHSLLQASFATALESAPPLAAATLFDTKPDLIPDGARGQAAILALAERLAGLDLPDHAAALLRRAMTAASDPAARGAIGARLAAMRAAEGDHAGVIAALDASESDHLDPALAERRIIQRARALLRSGEGPRAEALLGSLGPAGAEARAALRVEMRDWAGAAVAMADHLATTLPPRPAPLGPEHRAALARRAAYLALAGDDDGLLALRAAEGERMEGGDFAETFAVLTSDPLRGLSDMPRLQRELGLARLMPTRLEALRAGAPVAR